MIDRWDDLKFLLAVARHGSYTLAGKQLRVDQTTVTRRVRALESSLGSPLFERSPEGLQLTAAGEVLKLCGEAWEAHLHDAGRRLDHAAGAMDGSVRIALPELLAIPLMGPLVTAFASEPNLTVELVVSDSFHNIQRREADLAVRVTATPPEHLIAHRVGGLATAVYAAARFDPTPLDEVPWIGWDPVEAPTSQIEQARLQHGPQSRHALFVNSYGTLLAALKAGAGATFVPCIAGDVLEGVTRRTSPETLPYPVWVLTHPELRKSARIAWAKRVLLETLAAQRAALVPTPARFTADPAAAADPSAR